MVRCGDVGVCCLLLLLYQGEASTVTEMRYTLRAALLDPYPAIDTVSLRLSYTSLLSHTGRCFMDNVSPPFLGVPKELNVTQTGKVDVQSDQPLVALECLHLSNADAHKAHRRTSVLIK